MEGRRAATHWCVQGSDLVDSVRCMELNLRLEIEARSMKAALGTLGCGALAIRRGPQTLTQALRHVDILAYLLMDAPDGLSLLELTTIAGATDLTLTLHDSEAVLADRVSEGFEMVVADGPLQNTLTRFSSTFARTLQVAQPQQETQAPNSRECVRVVLRYCHNSGVPSGQSPTGQANVVVWT